MLPLLSSLCLSVEKGRSKSYSKWGRHCKAFKMAPIVQVTILEWPLLLFFLPFHSLAWQSGHLPAKNLSINEWDQGAARARRELLALHTRAFGTSAFSTFYGTSACLYSICLRSTPCPSWAPFYISGRLMHSWFHLKVRQRQSGILCRSRRKGEDKVLHALLPAQAAASLSPDSVPGCSSHQHTCHDPGFC